MKSRSSRPPARKTAAPASVAVRAAPTGLPKAALVLWVGLAALALARAVLAFVPDRSAWSLDLLRFLAWPVGWVPWALGALALVPAVARGATPLAEALGRFTARSRLAPFVWALALFAITITLPDRTRFVGDFLLRQGELAESVSTASITPQSLPLDAWLHYDLMQAISKAHTLDPAHATRLLGALEAALLGAGAVAFARALGLEGAAAFAAAAVAAFGGYLGVFTGYAKAFSELVTLGVWIAAFALRAARDGRRLLALGIATALAVLVHRAGLFFLPVATLAWALAVRAGGAGAWRRPAALMGIALPWLALALVTPRLLLIFRTYDAILHVHSAAVAPFGSPRRFADLANVAVLLAPLTPAAVLGMFALGPAPLRTRAGLTLAALALPFTLLLLGVTPLQGLVRDWDVFTPVGVAFALCGAAVAGAVVRSCAPLGLAVALAAIVPSVQWLAHNADFERGFERIHAIVEGPPLRIGDERARTWDYLGVRYFRLERWSDAAHAMEEAAALGPSPRILAQWEIAASHVGDQASMQKVYRRIVEVRPRDPRGWLRLAAASARLGDYAEARRAGLALQSINPADSNAVDILRYVERAEAAQHGGRVP